MSWSLSKPNVQLRVTKFASQRKPVPIAGLTDAARESHRAARAVECAKVEPPIYEVRKGLNRYLGNFVEIVPIDPHPVDCPCVICDPRPQKLRPPYDELYLKQKADPWR